MSWELDYPILDKLDILHFVFCPRVASLQRMPVKLFFASLAAVSQGWKGLKMTPDIWRAGDTESKSLWRAKARDRKRVGSSVKGLAKRGAYAGAFTGK